MLKVQSQLFDCGKLIALSDGLRCGKSAALGILLRLWLWTERNRPDGFLDGVPQDELGAALNDTPAQGERLVAALVSARLLDAEPLRVHGWWERYESRLRDFSRRSPAALKRYQTAAERWKKLGGAAPLPAAPRLAEPEPPKLAPATKQKKQPAQLTLTGEAVAPIPEPRAKTNQQLIVEKFATCKKFDMSTPAAVQMAFKANASAASQIDKLSSGDLTMALTFVEVGVESKEETMRQWTARDGQEHRFSALAALLPLWSEFRAAYEKHMQSTSQKEAAHEHREAPGRTSAGEAARA